MKVKHLIIIIVLILIIVAGKVAYDIEKNKDLTYQEVDGIEGTITQYRSEGYKLLKKNGNYYLIITLGEKSSNGYEIKINHVEINKKDINVEVEEAVSSEESELTMNLTYPSVILELNGKPENVYVEEKSSGRTFEKII